MNPSGTDSLYRTFSWNLFSITKHTVSLVQFSVPVTIYPWLSNRVSKIRVIGIWVSLSFPQVSSLTLESRDTRSTTWDGCPSPLWFGNPDT